MPPPRDPFPPFVKERDLTERLAETIKAESLRDHTSLDTLTPGIVIGPPDRRLRLLYDLTGKKRLWLVRAMMPQTDASGQEEGLQVIKILLPINRVTPTEGNDDRAQRTDLIGLRAYVTRAKARVELASRFSHPHNAQVFGWRQGMDGWPFAEMEYVNLNAYQTLAQRLAAQKGNVFPWEDMMAWLYPVVEVLDAARTTHQIAHQHLSADSIAIGREGDIKLLGFGVATEPREPKSLLFTGTPPGANEEGSIDSVNVPTLLRRDVFALSLLIYQLLTGRDAYTVQETSHTITCPLGLKEDAWRILRRGFAYPSELCPTDAGTFLQTLDAAQRPGFSAQQSRSQSLRRLSAGSAMGAAVLAPIVYWWMHDTPPKEAQEVAAPANPVISHDATVQAAAKEADTQAFSAAQRVGTVAAYRLYLQRCPPCAYEETARAIVQQAELSEKVQVVRAAFDAAMVGLEKEGRGEKGEVALSQWEQLAALVPDDPVAKTGRSRIAVAWAALAQARLNQSDLNGARQWLKKAESLQPDLPELKTIAQRCVQAEASQYFKQVDTQAFHAAQKAHSRKSYWVYLERCSPICGHRAAAEKALRQLDPGNKAFRDKLKSGGQGPEMVPIPQGRMMIGSSAQERSRYADEPPRVMAIEKPFALGKYEVTFDEYDVFARAAGRQLPSDEGWGRGKRPVVNVTLQEAMEYADWLSAQTGQFYRLPTEAEWEYGARAGSLVARFWGDDADQGCAYANAADLDGKRNFVGWTAMQCRDGAVYTMPAGSYRNNDFGLYDTLGNAAEWTCSLYDQYSQATEQVCPALDLSAKFVIRGGAWNDEPRHVRLADRLRSEPGVRSHAVGFRVLREMR